MRSLVQNKDGADQSTVRRLCPFADQDRERVVVDRRRVSFDCRLACKLRVFDKMLRALPLRPSVPKDARGPTIPRRFLNARGANQ
jgi:hypothetical protein